MTSSSSTMKTFSLSQCDWIGFDLDHTLIRYRLGELHTLIYELMCQYLVDTHQYTSKLLQIPYDHYFGVKALIYDSLYGNLIQLDSQGLVHTAFHGVRTRLSSKQIQEIYPHALEDIEEDPTKRYLCIFTYFDFTLSYLLGQIVDLIETNEFPSLDSEKKFSFFLPHLKSGFEYLFGDFHRGKYFSSIRENPERFIYQRRDIRQWLEKFKQSKKRLFLATNSRLDYTELLMKYAFEDDWKDLFDLTIVDCKKPLFFSNRQAFHRVIDEKNIIPVTPQQIIEDINTNSIYTLGNSRDLHSIMTEISGKDPLVIYFGDHMTSDITALKRHTNWLAGIVLEELEFDPPPPTPLHSFKQLPTNNSTYIKGNPSKYFSSFFTSPSNPGEPTEPDAILASSYWYNYITKHAHLSLSCLSVLANHFDFDDQFQYDQETKHLILMHKKDE